MINGPNTYTYVSQNPWSMFDPLGLQESALSTPSAPKATPKPQWQGPYPNSPKTSPPKKLSQGPIRVSGSLDAALLTTTAPQAIHGVATTEGQNVGQNAASYALSKGYITTEQYKTVVERIGQLSAPELGMIQNASGIARQNITNQAKEIIVEAMRNNPTAGQSNPVATAQKVKETNVPLVVYRRGGDTLENYTPALKDLEHPGFGYSTTLIPSHGPNQILMPSKLGPQLESIRDGANHVSFWPKDRSRFPEWVHSRGSNPAHPFTYEVQASRIDRIKVK
jgi:hypothetical protein